MQRSARGLPTDTLLEPPVSPDVLPNIPGGQDNLLPVSALARPLRIEVPMWDYSNPSPDYPEKLFLYWGAQLVEEKTWFDTIPPQDLYADVPVALLAHGQVLVTYRVHGYNGSQVVSEPLTLTIDKIAPLLGGEDGALIVEEQVLDEGVTVSYLESHGDRLLATVPGYDSPAVGDMLTYYWDRAPFANEQVAELEVTDQNVGQPLVLEFPGDMIREREDGARYIHYRVRDRAGNVSARSQPVTLAVTATPVPRSLSPVLIAQAEGSGPQLTLALDDFDAPLLIEVPAEVMVYPGETITVVWGEPGSVGHYSTRTPYEGRDRHFEIPVQKVLAQSKRTLPVIYQVDGGDSALDSDPVRLEVRAMTQRLPQVNLVGADSTGFHLASAPAHVPIKLDTWRMIAEGQRVSIQVTGVLQSGNEAPAHDALVAHPVSATQARQGIGMDNAVTVPKTYLASLRLNERFTVSVQVSFDEGGNWVRFPSINLTLRA
ncbi:hypothetical protein HTV13_12310 [Pseudomonas putida]|nr:hypothetical protein [Pseudomonas putida]QPN47978.1 hypothetical protein I5S86_08340 [Priestia aryabhattai]RRV42936.1 hypothetical protein EGJ09_21740 [Pseudomonas sp. p106]HDS1747932.1 hypothetical protein [Pseudomonas putida]HDS1757671.1 hypothetical protein [Pseudomonas putida]